MGGGGVAGGRGTTLERAARPGGGAEGSTGTGAGVAAEACGLEGGSGAAEVSGPEGAGNGWRNGGGGGTARGPPGGNIPGTMPRDEGGGGMRDVGAPVPIGRGTTLTGRGRTLAGAAGGTEAVGEGAEVVLGSFSSPIEISRKPRAPRLYPKRSSRARFRCPGCGRGGSCGCLAFLQQFSARSHPRRQLASHRTKR
jgi:hypothetical protein